MPINLPNLGAHSRCKDYWYLDRKRVEKTNRFVLRTAWVTATAGVMLLGTACCSNKDSSFAQNYAEAYGPSAQRGTSGLLETTTGLLTGTTDTLLNTTTDTLNATTDVLLGSPEGSTSPTSYTPLFKVSVMEGKWYIDCSAAIDKVIAYYTNGESSEKGLSTPITFDQKGTIAYVCVKLKSDGSKWFFDSLGNPLPQGYRPGIAARSAGGKWFFDSTDRIDKVLAYYYNGDKQDYGYDAAKGVTLPNSAGLSHVSVRLKSDGSLWDFSPQGAPLPGGYVPQLALRQTGGKWFFDSSDRLDKVFAYYASGEVKDKSWDPRGVVFDGRGPISHYGVRLKSDGGKWYFDNQGLPLPSGLNSATLVVQQ